MVRFQASTFLSLSRTSPSERGVLHHIITLTRINHHQSSMHVGSALVAQAEIDMSPSPAGCSVGKDIA